MLTFTSLSNFSIARTGALWFFSNVGGTLLLGAEFSLDRTEDFSIGLLCGLLAALVSLMIIPLCVPFFMVVGRLSTCTQRRLWAAAGVLVFFGLANMLLLYFLPIVTFKSMLSMSMPYLAAALGAVYFLCEPAPAPSNARC